MSEPAPLQTFYDAVGGRSTFVALVKRFYQGVASDPPLRALYPEPDLASAEERLRMFLEQYWGGPTTYSEQRGHPRLRMRHAPFAVTPAKLGMPYNISGVQNFLNTGGMNLCKEMLFTAQPMSVHRLVVQGIVSHAVPREQLEPLTAVPARL